MKFIFLFSVLLAFNEASFAKELVDKVIATISNEVVLFSDLKNFSSRISHPGSIDETLLLGDSLESLKTNKSTQLDFLVREKILAAEIKRLGMGATDSQIDSELSQMSKRAHMSASDFSNYIANQGYTLDEYKKVLQVRIERQGFFEKEIISKLRITDEDALSVYQTKNPNSRQWVGEFKISQIFFSNKKGGPAAAAARANAVLQRLLAKESFASLANQFNETPGANLDGFLGSFKTGEFLPEIESSIEALKENQISTVIKGPSGFHIVKLLSKKSIVDPNFLKVKEAIKSSLVQQNFERQLKNWFELKKLDSNLKVYEKIL